MSRREAAPGRLTIGELGTATGRAASALRYYEHEGFLEPVGRDGGKRVYDPDAVRQVALVDFLQQCGLTIAEIRGVVERGGRVGAGWRDVMAAKIEELKERRARLEVAIELLEHSVACPEARLDACPVFREGMRQHADGMGAGSPTR